MEPMLTMEPIAAGSEVAALTVRHADLEPETER